ncbi:pyridoxamine 5'-phosphate oxidase family protein [Oscillibacter sp.]|uniref:pyridoxamine 5'-phosphate oxidase family protein n=1 Tax=Oscillibacter sp. TaxID=1945593 RepID=UPI0028A7A76F|nr:pyridoxamine 5'-phosphate oxidase family protein [Oscillibacter sp.]
MITEKFLDVISHEGVVALVTCGSDGAHVSNTWNSFLVIRDNKLLIPAAGMRETQKNIAQNNNIKLTLGSRDVMGYKSMGSGFLVEGTAKFLESGEEYDLMKEKFPFLNRVLEVTPQSIKQTL